jgi:hypothetical protein
MDNKGSGYIEGLVSISLLIPSMSTPPHTAQKDPNGSNETKGFHKTDSQEHLAGVEDGSLNARKAILKRKELRWCYIIYLPMLVLDLLIIILMSWEVSPQIQDQAYTDGYGAIAPIIMLTCVSDSRLLDLPKERANLSLN